MGVLDDAFHPCAALVVAEREKMDEYRSIFDC